MDFSRKQKNGGDSRGAVAGTMVIDGALSAVLSAV